MKSTFNKFAKFLCLPLAMLALVGCEDLLEQKPSPDGSLILVDEAIETAEDLQEVLNSAYDVMSNAYNGRVQNPNNLLTDNLIKPQQNADYTSVWNRRTTIFNGTVGDAFYEYYVGILRTNTVIENLDEVTGLSSADRTRMEAEAKFLRGLFHFDAVRSYAHPYNYTSGNTHPGVAIRIQSEPFNAPRSTVQEVYSQVLSDIAFAKANLPEDNDIYANKWSAIAVEAEIRFQMHDYQRAWELANECITMSPYIFDSEVNKYQHPQASPEALFYVFSVQRENDVDSRNGFFRDNYNSVDNNPEFRFQKEFYDLVNAQGVGLPRSEFYIEIEVDGNISYGTTLMDEQYFNIPIVSITQMMLIRAESAAETGGDLAGAIEDINMIRTRAYNSNIANLLPNASPEDIIEAARLERRLEFPCNGQRYHDIKRIGAQGEDLIIRDKPWDCNGMILQFPSTEGTDLFELNPSGGC